MATSQNRRLARIAAAERVDALVREQERQAREQAERRDAAEAFRRRQAERSEVAS